MLFCPKKHKASSFASAQGCNLIMDITFKLKFEIFFIDRDTSAWGDFFFF